MVEVWKWCTATFKRIFPFWCPLHTICHSLSMQHIINFIHVAFVVLDTRTITKNYSNTNSINVGFLILILNFLAFQLQWKFEFKTFAQYDSTKPSFWCNYLCCCDTSEIELTNTRHEFIINNRMKYLNCDPINGQYASMKYHFYVRMKYHICVRMKNTTFWWRQIKILQIIWITCSNWK